MTKPESEPEQGTIGSLSEPELEPETEPGSNLPEPRSERKPERKAEPATLLELGHTQHTSHTSPYLRQHHSTHFTLPVGRMTHTSEGHFDHLLTERRLKRV